MKKVVTGLVLLLLILAGGWYAAWNYLENSMVSSIEKSVEHHQSQLPQIGTDLTFDFSIQKTGFPTHFGLIFEKAKVSYSDQEVKIEVSQETPLTVKTPVSITPLITGNYDDLMFEFGSVVYRGSFSSQKEEGKEFPFSLSIDSGSYKGFMTDPTTGSETLNNVRVFAGDINLLNIDKIQADLNSDIINAKNTFNSSVTYKIEGLSIKGKDFAEVYSPETVPHARNTEIDLLTFSVGCESCPKPSETFISEMRALQKIMKNKESAVYKTDNLKSSLSSYIDEFEQNKSRFELSEFQIETQGAKISGNSYFSIVKDSQIDLMLSITAENMKALIGENNELANNFGVAGTVINSTHPVTFTATIKNGMFAFNGIPLFPVPSVKTLIDSIPESLDLSEKNNTQINSQNLPE